MAKQSFAGYKEVRLPDNRYSDSYKNPMSATFRYEYALYEAACALFGSVTCRSMCIERLRLYFLDLKHHTDPKEEGAADDPLTEKASQKTQMSIRDEIESLMKRDVLGKINFPSMHECHAESRAIPDENGAHTFVFTDGIYGFSLKLQMPKKGSPKGILVANLDD
ncbi:MAG: hypothetical protein K5641_02915 [Lachnospiraceae bacterium]|nr:hypothetical protein [Lachnospiraceae bacterium]